MLCGAVRKCEVVTSKPFYNIHVIHHHHNNGCSFKRTHFGFSTSQISAKSFQRSLSPLAKKKVKSFQEFSSQTAITMTRLHMWLCSVRRCVDLKKHYTAAVCRTGTRTPAEAHNGFYFGPMQSTLDSVFPVDTVCMCLWTQVHYWCEPPPQAQMMQIKVCDVRTQRPPQH